MTRVRITVEDPLLGDVEVEQDDHIGSWSPERQRATIEKLMSQAVARINGAYNLTPTKEATDQ